VISKWGDESQNLPHNEISHLMDLTGLSTLRMVGQKATVLPYVLLTFDGPRTVGQKAMGRVNQYSPLLTFDAHFAHKYRQTHTKKDRQADRQTDRPKDIQTNTHKERQTCRQADRQTDIQTHRRTDIHRQTGRQPVRNLDVTRYS
jgi:hypothetical protein